MKDIVVTGKLDIKTFFGISLFVFFKLRTIIILIIYFLFAEYLLVFDRKFDWSLEIVVLLAFVISYGGIIPLFVYMRAVKISRSSAAFLETPVYTLNEEKIEVKAETVSGTNNWKYILKMIERKEYFLLMLSARTFYYLPKAGFESTAEITRFKNLVNEKGIKMKYH